MTSALRWAAVWAYADSNTVTYSVTGHTVGVGWGLSVFCRASFLLVMVNDVGILLICRFPQSGNQELAQNLAHWVFHQKGVLRVGKVTHHRTGQKEPDAAYIINQEIVSRHTAATSCFNSCACMHMCVCVGVHMCACAHVCVCVCLCTCVCVCVRVHMCVCVHMHVHEHMHCGSDSSL